MSKRHEDVSDFLMVEDFEGKSVFNNNDEEERYQAFKERLMHELVAKGGNIYDPTWAKSMPQTFKLVEA